MLKSFIDKISKNQKKSGNKICDFVRGGLIFAQDGVVKLCAKSDCNSDSEFVLLNDFNGLWLNTDFIKSKINYLKSKFQSGDVSSNCQNCAYLVDDDLSNTFLFDFVQFSHWQCCFFNCSYCNLHKTDDLSNVEHFDILPVIQQLVDEGLITKDTKIIFDCGDATLHPEFDKIMYYFINYEMKNIEIYTSAQRYCHSVAEAIGKNIATVIVSLDGGCPYIFERVKGVNKYDITISNLKRYLEYQDKNKNNVIVNYTLIERVNDNKKEILDWFMHSRGLGVKKFSIDIDEKWYNNLNCSIPAYLQEIFVFAKEMSEFNNMEIVFSKRVNALYSRIDKKVV